MELGAATPRRGAVQAARGRHDAHHCPSDVAVTPTHTHSARAQCCSAKHTYTHTRPIDTGGVLRREFKARQGTARLFRWVCNTS